MDDDFYRFLGRGASLLNPPDDFVWVFGFMSAIEGRAAVGSDVPPASFYCAGSRAGR
jgi:hypothetical protein